LHKIVVKESAGINQAKALPLLDELAGYVFDKFAFARARCADAVRVCLQVAP
jgi:hypothetical protein